MFLDSGEGERARIELIPMIDVMFFLLVVFIFISLSLIKLNGVSLSLPKADSQPVSAQGKTRTVNISIRKDGSLYLGKKSVTLTQLHEELEAIAGDTSVRKMIVVSGDEGVRLQRLVDIMNLCNALGYSNLLIRTVNP